MMRNYFLMGLFWVDVAAMFLLTLLPVIVVADWRSKKSINHLRIIALLAGSVLALHLCFILYCLWRLAHPPPGAIVLDLSPLDMMLLFTINWSIPAGSIAMLLILAIAKSRDKVARVILGVISFGLSATSTVVCGKYMFDVSLAERLANHVWWLW